MPDEPQAVPPPKPPSRGRILFAEDDEPFRLGLSQLLRRSGFECDPAASGDEAMQLFRANQYDALLSDIDMPGNANLELIESLGGAVNGLPAILLTGRPTVETATRSVRLRVVAYLVKPPDFSELSGVLDAAIGDYRKIRLLRSNRLRLQDWDREIERLQSLLQQPAASDRRSAMQSYLRLNLRNLVVGLVELETLLVEDDQMPGAAEAMQQQELRNAVRKTVAVLEKTRDHFKSRELGELRKELAALVHPGPNPQKNV